MTNTNLAPYAGLFTALMGNLDIVDETTAFLSAIATVICAALALFDTTKRLYIKIRAEILKKKEDADGKS